MHLCIYASNIRPNGVLGKTYCILDAPQSLRHQKFNACQRGGIKLSNDDIPSPIVEGWLGVRYQRPRKNAMRHTNKQI
jgi:hypothetical protein